MEQLHLLGADGTARPGPSAAPAIATDSSSVLLRFDLPDTGVTAGSSRDGPVSIRACSIRVVQSVLRARDLSGDLDEESPTRSAAPTLAVRARRIAIGRHSLRPRLRPRRSRASEAGPRSLLGLFGTEMVTSPWGSAWTRPRRHRLTHPKEYTGMTSVLPVPCLWAASRPLTSADGRFPLGRTVDSPRTCPDYDFWPPSSTRAVVRHVQRDPPRAWSSTPRTGWPASSCPLP